MRIDAELDGGNIEVVRASDAKSIELAIRADVAAPEFRQWFHFRARGVAGKACRFVLGNAGACSYPDAFDGYRACASYDGRRWFRVPTTFDGEALTIVHTPHAESVLYAYFAPYSWERHERTVRRAARAPWVKTHVLGRTVQDRPMHMLVVGEESDDKRKIWVVARQHPGETMAEWFMEGLVDRLLDDGDPTFEPLLSRATLYLVPNMNPDGSVLGNLRSNAAGANLNRAWLEPSATESPEVLCVREAMERTGVDLFLDVHGDERNPYCFLAGCEGNPGYSDRIRFLENLFEQSLLSFNTSFQDEYGYPRDEPGGGDLRTAGNWVGETFDCLSYTVEMPFKDDANHPDERAGWSPERSMHLGHSALDSVVVCLDMLRGEIPIDLEDTQENLEADFDS